MVRPPPKDSSAGLPSWDCSKPADALKMTDWVNLQLNRIPPPGFYSEFFFPPSGSEEDKKWGAVKEAYNGNVEPLKLMLPVLAPFLTPPKRQRGKRFSKHDEVDPVQQAAMDARHIRALWKTNYGKSNRPKNDPVTAEQIAADRHSVDVEAVVTRLGKIRAK
jgi:hypothetical protein